MIGIPLGMRPGWGRWRATRGLPGPTVKALLGGDLLKYAHSGQACAVSVMREEHRQNYALKSSEVKAQLSFSRVVAIPVVPSQTEPS
jgi:hypothetical protein